MSVIMYVDFPHEGPFGKELTVQLEELARSINEEEGLIWKIWTENEVEKTAGGVYLFSSRSNAEQYLSMHSNRLSDWGYGEIRGRIFEINEGLSAINNGPIQ